MLTGKPEFSVFVSLGDHSLEAIESFIPKIEREAIEFFKGNPTGRNVFFSEGPFDEYQARKYRELLTETGSFTKAYFIDFNGGGSEAEINSMVRSFSDIPLLKSKGQSSEREPQVFHIHEMMMLDRLSRGLKENGIAFEWAVETLKAGSDAANLNSAYYEGGLTLTGLEEIAQGRFDNAIEYYKAELILQARALNARNKEIIDQVTDIGRDALANNVPARVFIRFGEAHHVIADALASQLIPFNGVVTPSYDFGELSLHIRGVLLTKLYYDPLYNPSRFEIMRSIASVYIEKYIEKYMQKTHLNLNRFETNAIIKGTLFSCSENDLEMLFTDIMQRRANTAVISDWFWPKLDKTIKLRSSAPD